LFFYFGEFCSFQPSPLAGSIHAGLHFVEAERLMEAPLIETSARLEWRLRYGEITFYPDAPTVSFSLTPVFPGCSDELAERGIVWDLWALMASVRQPGSYSILNSECGYPPDAYIEAQVLVSHPASEIVVWELDIKGLMPVLAEWVSEPDGFIRLVFVREEYEADIRAMLREVQQVYGSPVAVADLAGAYGYEHLGEDYPGIQSVVAAVFEPTIHGELDGEEFAELDAEAVWSREPIFLDATVLEIAFFEDQFFRADGEIRRDWIGRWFTRWAVLDAFRHWLAHVSRAFALRFACTDKEAQAPEGIAPNVFVLLPDLDIENCHRAGEYFAQTLQRSFREGNTAPGVTVRYLRLDLPRSHF
jgi:hypothetical protein